MKKIIVFTILIALTPQLFSQTIDTLVSGIHYTIQKDTTKEVIELVLQIDNYSEKSISVERLGLYTNKILFYNSANEKIGADFMACGAIGPREIKVDSSFLWRINPAQFIPILLKTSIFISSELIPNQFDSTYQMYWRIGRQQLGPINYYNFEKDLTTNLNHSDLKIRERSAELLKRLRQKK